MYIVQMADLHIGSSTKTNPEEKELLSKSAELINNTIPEGETVLLCLCGDIIDSKGLGAGDAEAGRRYAEAATLLKRFKKSIEDNYTLIVKCCPGNHDITHLDELWKFVETVDYGAYSLTKDKLNKCYTIVVQDTAIIFVNSCDGNQYEKGSIDYDALEKELIDAGQGNKIVVLHHTVMSMFDEDSSPIRNAAKLVNLIDKYDVIGVLHGHIHGREILSLGQNQCRIIGTGALLSRGNPNVNSQFNIIKIKNSIICSIKNCRYLADGGNNPWDIKELNNIGINNVFKGKTFSKIYKDLIDALDVLSPIYNLRIEVRSTYHEFVNDLDKHISGEKLRIGKKEWPYIELAKMWQAAEVPDELYFNHGAYFKAYYNDNEKNGIDYVVDELKKKPTSSRVVLSTYSMKDIIGSLDDQEYLPSLESIQFGIDGEKLIVHMHLRALEAEQFLRINICEIEYLVKRLRDSSVSFEKVEIIISAFRVQKISKFHCFIKAEIDAMDVTKLASIVDHGYFSKLYELIDEKKDVQETVIKMDGIRTVHKAMINSNDTAEEMGKGKIYGEELIENIGQVLELYSKLDSKHKNSSIQGESEKNLEEKIATKLDSVLKSIKELENETTS